MRLCGVSSQGRLAMSLACKNQPLCLCSNRLPWTLHGSQLAAASGEPSVKAANGTSLSGLLVAVAKYIAAAGSKGASLKAASPEVKQWL